MPIILTWIGFIALVLALVALDLGISRKKHTTMTVRSALLWSAFWISLSIVFGGVVWATKGSETAVQFFTGYLLEKSLSIDNLFVFLLIFVQFRVPAGEQHRVLTWGILGALIMRAAMIFAGIELINRYHIVIYIFGGFLVFTGFKTALKRSEENENSIANRSSVRFIQRILPFTARYDDGRFITKENGRHVGTMLLLTLLVIEFSDVVFAVDSIPAIFAVTNDPFIVFSSNILAILGLRALFFALAGVLGRFCYLHLGLGAILIMIGAKMCLSSLIKIPTLISLAAIVVILTITIIASLIASRARPRPVV